MEKPENDVNSIRKYQAGSEERELLLAAIEELKHNPVEVPLIINGVEVRTGTIETTICPHDHALTLARVCLAGEVEMQEAVDAAINAQPAWADMDWYHRLAIFRKAADIMAGPRRLECIVTIMLNMSKTPYEAEIDLAEMVDFWRFNAYYLQQIIKHQPDQYGGESDRFDWRPLEGFVMAIPPFNFFSIGGNLPTAPAMAGNVVIWKPAPQVYFSNYKIMQILLEAGLPPGVINFLPFPEENSGILFEHEQFAGLNFTGGHDTLIKLWTMIGANVGKYRNFPRVVGECGGKDFIFVHGSANLQHVAANIIRGAFEYQGQKCSAASRAYIPESMWDALKGILLEQLSHFKTCPTEDLECAVGALIDAAAFQKVVGYLEFARQHPEDYEFVCGGTYDETYGWFVDPAIILSKDPRGKLMQEEIFGPVLTVYVYPDAEYADTLSLCNSTSPYGLTGAIFATDRTAIAQAERALRFAAGNLYINDKPTGAVVGRQPFGGGRASGTNDKAGSFLNMLRWLSPRAIKEALLPATDWRRPHVM